MRGVMRVRVVSSSVYRYWRMVSGGFNGLGF